MIVRFDEIDALEQRLHQLVRALEDSHRLVDRAAPRSGTDGLHISESARAPGRWLGWTLGPGDEDPAT